MAEIDDRVGDTGRAGPGGEVPPNAAEGHGPTGEPAGPAGRRRRVHLGIAGFFAVGTIVMAVLAVSSALRYASRTNAAEQLGNVTGSVGFSTPIPLPAPPISLPSLRDPATTIRLSQFRGHPVVVNFWASYCTICNDEAPALAASYSVAHDAVDFLGVDAADSRAAALAFASRTGASWPLAFDANASTIAAYGMNGLPVTFFIDARGRLVGENLGAMSTADMLKDLDRLFGLHLSRPAG